MNVQHHVWEVTEQENESVITQNLNLVENLVLECKSKQLCAMTSLVLVGDLNMCNGNN